MRPEQRGQTALVLGGEHVGPLRVGEQVLDHQGVYGLTALLADVNARHPFREGNGRTQRAFLTQLARDAGHPVHWARMDPTVNVAAAQAAHRGNNGPLRAMLDELVDNIIDARDVPGERAPASEAHTVARGFEAPAPRIPGDNEPRC